MITKEFRKELYDAYMDSDDACDTFEEWEGVLHDIETSNDIELLNTYAEHVGMEGLK